MCPGLPYDGRGRGDGEVRDLHGSQPDVYERPDEPDGWVQGEGARLTLLAGEFDHVDYKGKKTKCRSACEDQVCCIRICIRYIILGML